MEIHDWILFTFISYLGLLARVAALCPVPNVHFQCPAKVAALISIAAAAQREVNIESSEVKGTSRIETINEVN